MRLMTLGLLIAVTCTACSDEDIQIGFEKVGSQNKNTVHEGQKEVIYIEFKNTENGNVMLLPEKQVREQEAVEGTKEIVEGTKEIVEGTKEIVEGRKEKTYGELLDEKMKLSLQDTIEKYREMTPIEVINQRMRRLLEEVGEESRETTPIAVMKESFREAFNKNSNIDISTDQALIKQHETTLAEIDDTKIVANYDPKGNPIDLEGIFTPISGSTSIKENPDGFGFSVDLSGDYLFEFDQNILTVNAEETLQRITKLYKQYDGIGMEVAGHTDSKGSSDYNLVLSQRRANSVKRWFESAGINPTLITTAGYGETQPVASNAKNNQDNTKGRSLNRRINISVKTNRKINVFQENK